MKNLFLFDFDGTISNQDSTKYYFKKKLNPFIFIVGYYFLPLIQIFRFIIFNTNYDLKVARIKHCISLMKFYDKKINANAQEIDEIVYAKAKIFISDLAKNNSAEIYIVSASWNFILKEWANENKLELICNEISYKNGKVKIKSDFDCDKEGKLILIKKNILNFKKYDKIIAYGNSLNDFNMFSLADEWFLNYFKE